MTPLPAILDGIKVFPCSPGTKDPATKHGWHDASSDPSRIAEWKRVNPDWNWAVACGPSGLFVFDIDPAGLDWWANLLERDPAVKAAVDKAFQVRTPKGGLHVYFRGQGPSTASRIAPGIDTRGGIVRSGKIVSGGYVILPGSKTKAGPGRVDGAYAELPGGMIHELPEVMRALVPERKKTDTLGLAKNPDADNPRNVQWAVDLLKGYVANGRVSVEGHGGNNTAFQVVASVLDKAISPGLAFELIAEHWNPHCSPPWDEWELESLIRNAAEYGEDTGSGVKGFQTNEDAFSAYAGMETPEIKAPEKATRRKLQWLHEYADSVRDPEWLIPSVLPARGVGMLYGESGSYKSFLALDMGLCLAFGIAGQWGAPPVKNDVLFFAGEGPVATAKKRWPAWMEWQSQEFRGAHRFILQDRIPPVADTEQWENIKLDLAEMKAKPALIVIDTMARLMVGLDENSTKDATLTTNFLENLSRYYECFVLAIHHTGKDQNKGARGSSAFYANLDMVASAKIRVGGMEFRIRKQKDADVPDDGHYLTVREISGSIVLEKSENPVPGDDPNQAKGSRYPWASAGEIVQMLQTLNGGTTHSILCQEIAGKYGIDVDIVRKQLAKADDLAYLRPTKTEWKIPSQTEEFDL